MDACYQQCSKQVTESTGQSVQASLSLLVSRPGGDYRLSACNKSGEKAWFIRLTIPAEPF